MTAVPRPQAGPGRREPAGGREAGTEGHVWGDLGGGAGLAVGSAGSDGVGEGRVALLVLAAPPGEVVASDSLDAGSAPPDAVGADTNFGRALAALDVDADGDPELAVGALSDAAQTLADPIWLLELGDTDDDHWPNFLDNCEQFPNPLQNDSDGDGIGDFCDVCPQVDDPDQFDDDGDGTGNACEPTRLRLTPMLNPSGQRTQWILDLECGASDVHEVVAVLTPSGADVNDLEFGGTTTLDSCDSNDCNSAMDPSQLGARVSPVNSRAIVTNAFGNVNPPTPAIPAGTPLIAQSLYVFLEGNLPTDDLLCTAGEAPVFLGNLNWSPPDAVSDTQVVLSIAQVAIGMETRGPILDASGPVDNFRVECNECGYDPIPVTRTVSFFSSDGGGNEVLYTLSPALGETPGEVWELCFSAPELLHRIAVSAEPLTGFTGTMKWLGCEGSAGTINHCVANGSGQEDSPYESIYTTVDVETTVSFSYTPPSGGSHYLLLEGDVSSLQPGTYSKTLSNVPHTSTYFPEEPDPMTCVARLQTLPAIPGSVVPPLKALESVDMLALPAGAFDCVTHPVLQWDTPADTSNGCTGTSLPLSVAYASNVPEDVDGDGRRPEEDNCPYFANTTQSDIGGNNSPDPDGKGDVCQCGEANGNGIVQVDPPEDDDVATLRDHLASPDAVIESRCSVAGSGACTILDAVVLQRATSPSGSFEGDFVANCAANRP